MPLRRLFLTSAAALAVVSSPALAAPTIIGSGGSVTLNAPQSQPAGSTTQIRFDDGSMISFVGQANYVITGDREVRVITGNVTVLGRSLPLTIVSGTTTVTVQGGTALTVTNGAVRSHVFSGSTQVNTGRESRAYTAGQAWQSQGGNLSRMVAAGPQAVAPVINLRGNGISAAALNGLPVVLGEALAALGASSDIISAGRSFDAVQQGVFDASASVLPRDLETLIGFQSALASRLGSGAVFQGSSPAIIDTYLRYLASGGRIAEFQSAYTALITSYLELLSTGGAPADFSALGGLDIQAYLDYLQSVQGLDRLGASQQSLVAEYLAFLRGGGDPSTFIFSSVQLDADVIAIYQSTLTNFVAFVRGGGAAVDFEGANQDLIARYIRLLASSGQLNTLFGPQADVLQAYSDFLVAGGSPGDFGRFDEFGLSETLIAEYTTTLQTYLTFLFNGGNASGFDVDVGTLVRLIAELEQADALITTLPERRAVLLEFAAFVRAGNAAADFLGFYSAGLSDAAVAQYAVSVSSLLSVYAMGGTCANFDGNIDDIIRTIQILEAAGRLDDEFVSQRAILLQFVTFVTGGGDPTAFDGFIALGFDVATVTSYVATINTLLSFVFEGGDLSGFDGDVTAIVRLIQALESSGQLQTALRSQRSVLLDFVTFINDGGNVATFRGFLDLGLSDTVVQSYSDAITVFLQFIIDGGVIAEFTGDISVILSNINDLQSAGRLSGAFSGASLDALLAFSVFVADGGTPGDFTGFEGLTDTGGGGNPDTGDGYSAGPDVTVVAGIDRDAIAAFPFLGSLNPTPNSANASGVATIDIGERFGSNRVGTPGFDIRVASTDDDGLPSGNGFFLRDMDLVAAARTGDVLLTRHTGDGTASIGGQFSNFDGTVSLNTAFIANPSTLLPTSGQIIYDLSDTLGVDVIGDYDGEITLDAVLGLRFGSLPQASVNGVLSADDDYIFTSSMGDGTGGIIFDGGTNVFGTFFGVSGRIVSGEGVFCGSGASCTANFSLRPTADYSQLGGVFRTRSSSTEDLVAYTAVSFLARSGFTFETIVPDVTPSGSVSAAFGADRAILLRATGGSQNRNQQVASVTPRATLGFDDQGLSEMFRGFSNSLERGDGAVVDLAGDENWQVGRWVGRIGPDIYSENSGLSYAIVPLIDARPANGRIEYSLLGASNPVYGDGSTAPGTFTGNAVLVLDTASYFGIDATVTMPDAVYAFTSVGGLDNPSIVIAFQNQMLRGFGFGDAFTTTVTGNGAACGPDTPECATLLQIGIGGENAEYAGISYQISDRNSATTSLTGTAVLGGTFVPDEPEPTVDGTERTDQHIVYASNTVGIDSRNPATVIYDETTGAPLAYTWDLDDSTKERERPQIGTATQHETGSVDGLIGWTRWAGGRSAGRYFDITNGIDLPENAGWHVLSGTPATNLPTSGTVSYDLIGNTSPTVRNGTVAPGTLDSAKAAVAFGTTARVGVELAMTVGGEGYNISTNGGVSDLSQGLELTADQAGRVVRFNGNAFNGSLIGSGGSLCAGTTANCNASLTGFLAGDGASHLGLAYTMGNTGFDNQIDGTAAFAQSTSQTAAAKPEIRISDATTPITPVIDETWTRWTQSGGGAGDIAPVRLQNANGLSSVGYVGDTIPDWITFDHR
jgi:hypothetical protein